MLNRGRKFAPERKTFMKTFFSIIALILVAFSAKAQIAFEHGTLEEALAKAKKEKKLVFVDVFTTWCGPCKQMSANVFPQKEVGDYYNANFVSIKIDAEKGGGPAIASKYAVSAYPTMLYLKPDGSVVTKQVGMVDGAKLINKGMEAVDPTSSPLHQSMKAYHSSKKTNADLKNYVSQLMLSSADSMDFYVTKYYEQNPKLDLTDNIDFNVFYLKETNLYSPVTQDFLSHPERTESRAYMNKLSAFLNESFQSAVAQRDYPLLERDVRYLYPFLAKASPQNGDVETYLQYIQGEYNRITGQGQ